MRPRVEIEELERRVRESLEPGVELRCCGEDDPEDLGFHALDDGVSLVKVDKDSGQTLNEIVIHDKDSARLYYLLH